MSFHASTLVGDSIGCSMERRDSEEEKCLLELVERDQEMAMRGRCTRACVIKAAIVIEAI